MIAQLQARLTELIINCPESAAALQGLKQTMQSVNFRRFVRDEITKLLIINDSFIFKVKSHDGILKCSYFCGHPDKVQFELAYSQNKAIIVEYIVNFVIKLIL